MSHLQNRSLHNQCCRDICSSFSQSWPKKRGSRKQAKGASRRTISTHANAQLDTSHKLFHPLLSALVLSPVTFSPGTKLRSHLFLLQGVNGGGAIHAVMSVSEHSGHAKHVFPGGSNGLNVFRSNFTKNVAVSLSPRAYA